MPATPSTMPELGNPANHFNLPEPATGLTRGLADFAESDALLVMFICNHCPFVVHVADQLAAIARDYHDKGLAVVAINSNDADHYPDDAPEKMVTFAEEHALSFPYLFDQDQAVAKLYHAACTPDFFLYDNERRLAYRGQLDGARPGNDAPNDGNDLRTAIDAILKGTPAPDAQTPSMGCNIKWKPGNEPSYA